MTGRAAEPVSRTLVSPESGDAASVSAREHCCSCGRFVGPYERCPYCGARMKGRLAVRSVKLGAVLLATLGLALVWWASRGIPVPEISIGDACGTMNLAYVRLHGTLTRGLTYDPESGYLGFWLVDDTGEVHVNAYADVTPALFARGIVPAMGDDVTVAGTLRIREDYVTLTLNVPEHLSVQRPVAVPVGAGKITLLDEGRRVCVQGHVIQISEPYDGLTLVDIQDDTGEITMAVDEALETLTGELPYMVSGQPITVTGYVTLYKTTPQIVPADVDDIQLSEVPVSAQRSFSPSQASDTPSEEAVLPAQPTVQTPIALSGISEANLGRVVCTKGRVVMLEGLPGGVKAVLDDGTAQVVLLLWNDVYGALEAPLTFDVGAEVTVTGKVQLYGETLEVVPVAAADVEILTPAERPPWVALGELSAADAGRIVRTRGVLREPQGFSSGVKVVLKDGTGDIIVLFWSELYQALAPKPQAGQQVEVSGVVDVYRDELELIPRSKFDWHVRRMED